MFLIFDRSYIALFRPVQLFRNDDVVGRQMKARVDESIGHSVTVHCLHEVTVQHVTLSARQRESLEINFQKSKKKELR
jgi:hypothetical protein